MIGAWPFLFLLVGALSALALDPSPSNQGLNSHDLDVSHQKCLKVVIEEKSKWALDLFLKENLPWIIQNEIDENSLDTCTHLLFVANISNWIERINSTLSPRSTVIIFSKNALPKVSSDIRFLPNLFLVESGGMVVRLSRSSEWTATAHMASFNSPFEMLNFSWRSKFKGTMNLNGALIKATSFNYIPWCRIEESPSGGAVYSGIEVTLAQEVAKALNGSMVISSPGDGLLWGTFNTTIGTYTGGLIGKLLEGKTDLGFAQLFMQARLFKDHDYSHSYDVERACFVTAKPDRMSQSLALIKAFTPRVWLFFFITGLCSGLLFVLHNVATPSENRLPSKGHALLLLLSIITVESDRWFHSLRKSSLLCLLPPLVLGFFVLSSGYSIGMVSLLTIPLRDDPINTLQDIVESGIVPATKSIDVGLFAKTTTDPWLLEIRDEFQNLPPSLSFKDAFTNAEDKKIILLQAEKFIKYTIQTQFSNKYGETELHIVKQCPQTYNIALGLPKGSVLKPAVDKAILQFSAAGLIKLWTENEIGNLALPSETNTFEESNFKPFTLDNLQGPFIVTFCSLFGPCSMAFALELGAKAFRQRRRTTVQQN